MKVIQTKSSADIRGLTKKAIELSSGDFDKVMDGLLTEIDRLLLRHLPSNALLLADSLSEQGAALSGEAMRELGLHLDQISNIVYRLKKAMDSEKPVDMAEATEDWTSRGKGSWR